MADMADDDLGFRWRARKDDEVEISREGRVVTILRGKEAQAFLPRAANASDAELQQRMARLTGNYKRGNERAGKRRRS